VIRTLNFDHEGKTFRLEIEDYGDSESSDTVTVYGPEDTEIASYDSTVHSAAAFIAEAKLEID